MNRAYMSNIGALVAIAMIGAGTATAAGAGDNTKVNGQSIDRFGFSSCKVAVAFKATLAQGATLSIAIEVQESDDATNWTTAEVLRAASVASTGGQGGTTNYDVATVTDDLTGRKRYVRYNVTPDLSAAGTDTLVWSATCTLGGADTLPVPQ